MYLLSRTVAAVASAAAQACAADLILPSLAAASLFFGAFAAASAAAFAATLSLLFAENFVCKSFLQLLVQQLALFSVLLYA